MYCFIEAWLHESTLYSRIASQSGFTYLLLLMNHLCGHLCTFRYNSAIFKHSRWVSPTLYPIRNVCRSLMLLYHPVSVLQERLSSPVLSVDQHPINLLLRRGLFPTLNPNSILHQRLMGPVLCLIYHLVTLHLWRSLLLIQHPVGILQWRLVSPVLSLVQHLISLLLWKKRQVWNV